jgi:hypothetical protein
MRASTSASQARGSTSFSFAVVMSAYIIAARSPPRSLPANSQAFLPRATPRSARSAGLVWGDADHGKPGRRASDGAVRGWLCAAAEEARQSPQRWRGGQLRAWLRQMPAPCMRAGPRGCVKTLHRKR